MTSHKKPTPRPTRDWDSVAAGVFFLSVVVALIVTSGDVAGPLKALVGLFAFLGAAAWFGRWYTRPGTPDSRKADSRKFSNEDGFGPE